MSPLEPRHGHQPDDELVDDELGTGELVDGELVDEFADGADEPLDADDQLVLELLGQAWEAVDGPPPQLAERMQIALAAADLDAELLRLQRETEPAGVRGDQRVRTMTFTSDSVTVMLTVTDEGAGQLRVDGWLDPQGRLRVEMRCHRDLAAGPAAGEAVEVFADEDGRFTATVPSAGLVQLVLHPTPESAIRLGGRVVTPAVAL
jgi:hypothetical protein